VVVIPAILARLVASPLAANGIAALRVDEADFISLSF
jgi:hypothetical protein